MAALVAASCKTETVYVYPDPNSIVSRLNVYPMNVSGMGFIDDVQLNVTIRPSTAKYTWVSSDPTIAYVDKNDKIVPLKTGYVEFTVSAGDFSQTVKANIHSSIVGEAFFMENNGEPVSMATAVKVLPEDTPVIVRSKDNNIVYANPYEPMMLQPVSPGSTTVTVTTLTDNISKDITVGVVAPANVVTATNATAYKYPGRLFGTNYDMEVMALTEAGRTYVEGGTWEGAARGLALKLAHDSKAQTLPNGTYTKGTGEGHFFVESSTSYVINAQGGREPVTGGILELTDNGAKASVTTANNVYIFNFNGKREEKERTFEFETIRYYPVTNDNVSYVSVQIDHRGETGYPGCFYGGYREGYKFTFTINNKNSVFLFYSKNETDCEGSYQNDLGFCAPGSYGTGGTSHNYIIAPFSTSTTRHAPDYPNVVFTMSNFNRVAGDKFFTVDCSGYIGYREEKEMVPEVNLNHVYDVLLDFNLVNQNVQITQEIMR